MKTHPKFPEYVAVCIQPAIGLENRVKLIGPQAESVCFDCPDRECEKHTRSWDAAPATDSLCPISGTWMHIANLTRLRLAGHDVELDTSEKTMSWKGD
jgi:hypothetical protein